MSLLIPSLLATQLALLGSTAPVPPDTFTVEQVRSEYPAFVRLWTRGSADSLRSGVLLSTPEESRWLTPLVKESQYYLMYIVQQAANVVDPGELATFGTDSVQMREFFYGRLRRDERFNALILPIISRFLTSRGGALQGYAPPPERSVAIEQVVAAAARLFYPDNLGPDGKVKQVHICSAVNGLRSLSNRDLAVEALAFAAVFRDKQKGPRGGSVVGAFFSGLSAIQGQADLPADSAPRLAAIQHRSWAQMERSEALRQAVHQEYQRLAEYLPFVVTD